MQRNVRGDVPPDNPNSQVYFLPGRGRCDECCVTDISNNVFTSLGKHTSRQEQHHFDQQNDGEYKSGTEKTEIKMADLFVGQINKMRVKHKESVGW